MIEFLVIVSFLAVFWFAIWSMFMMSPIMTVSILVIWLGVIYLLDRELRRG